MRPPKNQTAHKFTTSHGKGDRDTGCVVGEARLFKGSINIKEGTTSNVHIYIWHIIK